MQNNLLIDVSLGRDSFYTIMTAFQNESSVIEAITVQDPLMDRTCHGMLHLLDHLYTDIPVCKGRGCNLNYNESSYQDTSAGKWPEDRISLISASEMIYLKANQFAGNLTVISHSPLTNIAVFLKDHKSDINKIKKIIILENRTAKAKEEGFDFEPLLDIEAAKLVLESGIEAYFIPLNLLCVTEENKGVVDFIKNSTDTMIGRFLRHSKMPDNDEAITCSLAASLCALDGSSFTSVPCDIHAVITGDKKGSFIIGKEDPSSSIKLVTSIDYKKALTAGFGVVDTLKTIAYNRLHEGEHHHHD